MKFLHLSLLTFCCTLVFFSKANADVDEITNSLCVEHQCGNSLYIYTTNECVSLFDKYFDLSGGYLPYCLPSYEEKAYVNELYCYSNWKLLTKNDCENLFDPVEDQFGIVDEEKSTVYDICLMNKIAQADTCLLATVLQSSKHCRDPLEQCDEKYDKELEYVLWSECRDTAFSYFSTCKDEEEKKLILGPDSFVNTPKQNQIWDFYRILPNKEIKKSHNSN